MRTDQEITAEIQAARSHFQPGFYAWLAVLLSAITLPIVSMVVSIHLARASTEDAVARERAARRATELAMCVVVTTFTDAYKNEPPTTAAGREVAEGMTGLRLAYHCDER